MAIPPAERDTQFQPVTPIQAGAVRRIADITADLRAATALYLAAIQNHANNVAQNSANQPAR